MYKKALIFLSFLLFIMTTFSQVAVFFDIKNQRTTNHPTLGSAVAFDICMSASLPGTFHSRGQVYVTYNESKFGQNIVDAGKIVIEEGPMVNGVLNFFGTATRLYTTLNLIDNTANIFAVTWQSNFLNLFPNALIHTPVPDTSAVLYSVFIASNNNNPNTGIDIHRPLMANQQYMLTNNDSNGDGLPDEETYANGFLPVEYMGFDFEVLTNKTIQLNWITSREVNNDMFIVEKETGEGDFIAIGEVEGSGNTELPTYYEFIDETQLKNINYYRIKQVDMDGSFDYSPIIEVAFSGGTSFQVYPTVTTDFCNLKATGSLESHYDVHVFDTMGRILLQEKLEVFSEEGKLEFDLSSYNHGMYFIQVSTQAGPLYSAKVLKE